MLAGKRPEKGKPIKRYAKQEVAEHMRIVLDAWVAGATDREIKRILEQAGHSLGRARVQLLRERVQTKTLDESEAERPYSKARQARRIMRHIRDTNGQRAKDGKGWAVKPEHSARAKYEDMVARIEGNYEPVVIEVNAVHRHAVIEVMAGLSDEQWEQHVQAFDRMMGLAQAKARENGEQVEDLLPRPAPLPPPARANGANGKANGGRA